MLTASARNEVKDTPENATQTDLKLEPGLFEYVVTNCDVFGNLWDGDCWMDPLRGSKRLRRAHLFPLGPGKSLVGV